jgi:hypothetical protein
MHGLALRLLRDDGAVVYLNGHEVTRSNMPAGAINHDSLAAAVTEPLDFEQFAIDATFLVAGANILAVEIHQVHLTSSDISFDLELVGTVLATPIPRGVLANDTDGDGDPLTASRLSGPEHGTLDLSTNGSFIYRPDDGFTGEDHFVYEAIDTSGAASNHTTVTITVLPTEAPAPPGDFNGDRAIDAGDIDLLVAAVAAHGAPPAGFSAVAGAPEMPTSTGGTPETPSPFDLNSDMIVDRRDVDFLVQSMLETAYGDVDLDRRVALTDVARLYANFGRVGAGWADGDVTGDGLVDRVDVALVARNLGFGAETPQPAASSSAAVQRVDAHVLPRTRLAPREVDAVLTAQRIRRDHVVEPTPFVPAANGDHAVLRGRRATRRNPPVITFQV